MLALVGLFSNLEVGDGKPFSRIEDALQVAAPNATISVFPSAKGYSKTALKIEKPVHLITNSNVVLDGTGFDYSGIGRIPRAIIQIDPGGGGSSIEGFRLTHARNQSHNGAGIRINAANNVSVSRCQISRNDMGVMSSGIDGDPSAGSNQRFFECWIFENGSDEDPGYNHNLYLGGTSAYLDRCIVNDATTGHNVKSRAHFTSITRSIIYGGNNRQVDCPESWNTSLPNSNLLLFDDLIVATPQPTGNGNLIHFGREKGERNGKAYVLFCTIYTQSSSPVLTLSSAGGSAELDATVVINSSQSHPKLVSLLTGQPTSAVTGSGNWLSQGYGAPFDGLKSQTGQTKNGTPAIPWLPNTGVVPSAYTTLKAPFVRYVDGDGKTQTLDLWKGDWSHPGARLSDLPNLARS